ncbi:MAG TPA: LysR family transcriptional regulator [Ktedonobacterales bacterium]|nr:LysR family transcriptional regulator [Ktedonobacterales bacterium]HEX5571135.1 LysR family transcriptional regulator [Ktedonobacterales bacterium]
MNLQQLRTFRVVAQQRSYSRAAQLLYLSQPGVSLQVRALEQSIGMPLFERSGRQLRLTEAGVALLDYADRILSLVDESQQALEELGNARRGIVRVAASTTAGIYIVPRALGGFHRQNPGVRLTLDVVNRFTVADHLLRDEVDIAVMGLIEDAHDLQLEPFLPNELVVIASPHHPLAQRKHIAISELVNDTLLLREQGSGTRTDIERMVAQGKLVMRQGMELRSSGAIKQAVAADLGIAIIPLHAIELEILAKRLVTLNVEGFPIRRDWSIARRAGRRLSAAANALWDYLLLYRDEASLEFELA